MCVVLFRKSRLIEEGKPTKEEVAFANKKRNLDTLNPVPTGTLARVPLFPLTPLVLKIAF